MHFASDRSAFSDFDGFMQENLTFSGKSLFFVRAFTVYKGVFGNFMR